MIMVASCLLMGLDCLSQHSGKLTVIGKNLSLRDIFDNIERQTFYKVSYPADIFQDAPTFSLDLKNVAVDSLLNTCFANLPYRDSIFCRTNIIVYPRKGMVLLRGRVVDKENMPLVNATISIKGSPRAVLTNEEGGFYMTWKDDQFDIVRITYTGYYPQEIAVGKRNFLSVSMEPATNNMDETVVIPYGSARRRLNTESISEVKGSLFQMQPVDNVWAGLEKPGCRVFR